MPKLDLYLVGKIGYSFGVWSGDTKDYLKDAGANFDEPSGIAFGFDVGVAYYFTSTIGVFAEAGYDLYNLESKVSAGGQDITIKVPFNRFFTAGLSVKF
jgi:hypothetical protein